MKITRNDVKHVASLARLGLSDKEIDSFSIQLNAILEYMEKLNELDTTNVKPTAFVIEKVNAFREDKVKTSFGQEKTLKNAPEKEEGFFKVPKIIE
ncbi:MAG: Asp-tRNA(Asn)/Glu-tRNA(Gln) amidotransferase subunit GatB [Deltaproteobacteria bacterium]|nr:MAG: Asp-tRNA(Asn)/Glu-tRNA(Gln) amidotransferase subunit GatB [Deltaproteobacteria bacterium]